MCNPQENNNNFWNKRGERNRRRPRNQNEVVRRRNRRQRRERDEENRLILENERLRQEITQRRLQTLAVQEDYNNQLDKLARLQAEFESFHRAWLLTQNGNAHEYL